MEKSDNKQRDTPLEVNYAKKELGTNLSESKILGKVRDKMKDIFKVNLKITEKKQETKNVATVSVHL